MNDDIARLFQAAGRDMRPGFKQELRDLLVDVDADIDPSSEPMSIEPITSVSDREWTPHRRRWHRLVLHAAVTVAIVAGLALLSDRGTDAPSDTLASPSRCAIDAEVLGVVPTRSIDIQVALMADGHSFCLVDAARGSSLGSTSGDDLVINDDISGGAPSEPTIQEQGIVEESVHWYVISIPDGMPVAHVTAAERLVSFPARSGRQLLVFDEVDREAGDVPATELNLYSSTGVVLATLVVDTKTPPESSPTQRESEPTEGPP